MSHESVKQVIDQYADDKNVKIEVVENAIAEKLRRFLKDVVENESKH